MGLQADLTRQTPRKVHAGRQHAELRFRQQLIEIRTDELAVVDTMGGQFLQRPGIERILERLECQQVVFRWRAEAIRPERFRGVAGVTQDDEIQALLLQG